MLHAPCAPEPQQQTTQITHVFHYKAAQFVVLNRQQYLHLTHICPAHYIQEIIPILLIQQLALFQQMRLITVWNLTIHVWMKSVLHAIRRNADVDARDALPPLQRQKPHWNRQTKNLSRHLVNWHC